MESWMSSNVSVAVATKSNFGPLLKKNWLNQMCGDNYNMRDVHICFMAWVFQSSGQFTPERSTDGWM